ncbi:exodeoxyribonuclease III [Convivina intestini]|uniref:Exodeoxyribonuclease-3 n=1 Tax=Convivina intestini TaxID=1505726 RepID=A0A2U1D927_9LACO|nr:exodeoxyribonuclease III [Convivina intestini]PVY84194.1 exodeoxyribonuclease-3 [Convivina intestini]CAH1854217.1 Exodeoxyribonuclease [Convivina intestini]SDB90755.1 exodeoxyribonuclease-3 [Leuconostocaceae bacterium R-53105]
MKFISWNIDSINAAITHSSPRGEMTWAVLNEIAQSQPEVLAIQETKLKATGLTPKQEKTLQEIFPNYQIYTSSSTARSGYSGTMFLTKNKPENVSYPQLGAPGEMDQEGRVITLEYPNFYLATVYTPNSGSNLDRLPDRQAWDDAFRAYVSELDQSKPVIFSGDLNVAHEEIDLKHPSSNHHSAGFTDEERQKFTELLAAGFTDTMRQEHPDQTGLYTWWAQRSKTSKINNSGWRIDYYLVSNRISDLVEKTGVINTGARQDHAPIELEIKL